MSARIRLFFLALAACIPGVSAAQAPASANATTLTASPPMAAVRPHRFNEHGSVRIDQYYWLRDRDNPEVIKYLEDENAYTKAVMAHTEALQERLFEEIKGRIKQTDMSVPYRRGNYFYYTRVVEGKDYPIYARKRGSLDAPEEIMLDGNALAEGKPFFQVMGMQVSSGDDLLAFAIDTIGRRIATVRIKNLRSGELLPDVISKVTGNMAWAEDNRTLFYTKQDSVTLRWDRVYRHTVGSDGNRDELVYRESDDQYYTGVFKTKSRRYMMIWSEQTMASEYRFIPADRPATPAQVIEPRRRGHEYDVDHFGEFFYIRSNDAAKNFRLMRTPVAKTGRANWQEVIGHRADVLLQGFEIFRDHMVVNERKNGLVQLRVRPWSGQNEHYLDFGEPAYLAYTTNNPEFDTRVLRFGYTSLTTPTSIYDYAMNSRAKTLLKRDEVLGGFDPAEYVTERLYAPARDGVQIPVSIVYRKGARRPAQLLLAGYGSYGSSSDPTFSAERLSLLDRGFTYAIAHIRGGQELGRAWYEDGKLLKKKNTFTDFIDVAEDLVRRGYSTPGQLYARGGSAGGLLIGAVVNMRPDLFKGAIALVPFVDVITTMKDSTIPLTTNEYDEWGNPNDSTYYRYMLSYSPYDQVERKAYPNLLVTAGLHDSQVQYFEPAKWVARLRAMKTDNNRLILRTNMEAGHGGASGRYKRWRDVAFEWAFLLDLAGVRDKPTP
jgi:oligopeptidase B